MNSEVTLGPSGDEIGRPPSIAAAAQEQFITTLLDHVIAWIGALRPPGESGARSTAAAEYGAH
jgi:hypothetical protein